MANKDKNIIDDMELIDEIVKLVLVRIYNNRYKGIREYIDEIIIGESKKSTNKILADVEEKMEEISRLEDNLATKINKTDYNLFLNNPHYREFFGKIKAIEKFLDVNENEIKKIMDRKLGFIRVLIPRMEKVSNKINALDNDYSRLCKRLDDLDIKLDDLSIDFNDKNNMKEFILYINKENKENIKEFRTINDKIRNIESKIIKE